LGLFDFAEKFLRAIFGFLVERWALPLAVLCALLSGCHSSEAGKRPVIEFTEVPPAAEGGRDRVATISGRVLGATAGERVVVYARSGPWWVQPWPEKPFITIQSDSTWTTPTHLGYDYAALLVTPGYDPPPTMDSTPAEGRNVVAVAISKGVGTLPPNPTKLLRFSGYDWKVRMTPADRGGLNNLYDADNAWTDASGALHMRIAKRSDRWTCAQLVLSQSLGYGTYTFVVRDTSHLQPAAVLSMHTFDGWGADEHYREMDIEVSRWGDATSKPNAQYAIQPFYVPGDVARFVEPSGTLTHILRWEYGTANFTTTRGSSVGRGATVVSHHVFTSGVPTPGQERVELMLYVVASDKSPLRRNAEVVIEKFGYLP